MKAIDLHIRSSVVKILRAEGDRTLAKEARNIEDVEKLIGMVSKSRLLSTVNRKAALYIDEKYF